MLAQQEVAGFSRDQLRKLVRDVDPRHAQTREFDGKRLTYIEGWYAIAQANSVFGHAGWDREMVHFERVMERTSDSIVICGYMARVRIRVRAGTTEVIREGTGWGSASASTATAANERALKAAETDATKRALSTFGASFGLSFYDKDHVTPTPKPVFALFAPDGRLLDHSLSPEAYSTGLRQLIELCKDTYQVDQLSRHNRASLTDLRIHIPRLRNAQGVHFTDLLLRLMQRRRERVGGATGGSGESAGAGTNNADAQPNATSGDAPGSWAKTNIGDTTHGNGTVTKHAVANPRHSSRSRAMGPGEAFCQYTGQSPRRRTAYPFPSRVEGQNKTIIPPPEKAIEPGIDTAETEKIVAKVVKASSESGEPSTLSGQASTLSYPASHSASEVVSSNGEQLSDEAARIPETPDMLEREVTPPSKIAFGLKIDKSRLLLGLERRIRDKVHLRRVGELPCLVCNRQPSHAHHLRFAQRRGLSQKVSDEYVVPLCALHHGDLHSSSSERDWWHKQNIDPLPVSLELWSRYRSKN